jgi:hypothetical protein
MELIDFQGRGGRRSATDRRLGAFSGPVLEKRSGRNRRTGFDRRRFKDPIIRIVGDERRKAFQKCG